ncbi:MAG: hypothetical protein IK068_07720 [Lachnospiraceae bacterium]|nr:hypothetical protein [Lachnospiraceae bacterium]
MNRITNNELFKRIQKVASEQEVSLTYSAKVFYIRILDYALTHGEDVENGKSIDLPVRKMAEIAEVSDRMAETALKALSESGVILRNKISTRLAITIFLRSFYEA